MPTRGREPEPASAVSASDNSVLRRFFWDNGTVGKLLIVTGVLLVIAGLLVSFGGKYLGGLGRLPGDIVVRRQNFTFYFPVVTSILLSVVLTLLFWLFSRR